MINKSIYANYKRLKIAQFNSLIGDLDNRTPAPRIYRHREPLKVFGKKLCKCCY